VGKSAFGTCGQKLADELLKDLALYQKIASAIRAESSALALPSPCGFADLNALALSP
jgi:hypothetical protein